MRHWYRPQYRTCISPHLNGLIEVFCPSARASSRSMGSSYIWQFVCCRDYLRYCCRKIWLANEYKNMYTHLRHLTVGTIFLGITTAFLFAFCPETTYHRESNLNIDLGTVDHTISSPQQKLETDRLEDGANLEPPLTFMEKLRPYRRIESQDNLLKIIVRPIPLLLFPQVLYAFVTELSLGWLSVLYGILAFIFGSPPYNLSVAHLGTMSGIGGLIATVLSFAIAPLSDWLCKYLARRNKGIYEPEVKSPLKFLTTVSSCHDGFHVLFWHNWIFWIRSYSSLSTSLDYTFSLFLHRSLCTVNSKHCDICICYGLSA